MGEYSATVEVDVPSMRAFRVFTDASRFPQWQAMALRSFDQTGPLDQAGSSVRIDHGPRMIRTMTVLEADPPSMLRYRQTGMGFDDITTATFRSAGNTTTVSMSSELRVVGGIVGRILERAGHSSSAREYQAELDRFAEVARRRTVIPGDGVIVTAHSGAGFRVLKVLGLGDEVIHLALLPGVDRQRPEDPWPVLDRTSQMADPLDLRPLDVSIRNLTSKIVPGSPLLRLDGAVGVPHIAVTLDGYTDMRPEPLPLTVPIWDAEEREINSWRLVGGPVLGLHPDATVAPLLTVKVEGGFGAIKVLHADRKAVHFRLYSNRWELPPDDIDPWALRLGQVGDPITGVGHIPMLRGALAAWEPRFHRLVMVGPDELEGYRTWRESGGGVFG